MAVLMREPRRTLEAVEEAYTNSGPLAPDLLFKCQRGRLDSS